MAPSAVRYSVGVRLAAHRDHLVAARREHVDGEAADAAGRARHDDRAPCGRLPVLLHAVMASAAVKPAVPSAMAVEGIESRGHAG